MKKNDGTFEAWGLPGGKLAFESISARELKSIGAYLIIGSSVRKFRIHHVENQGFHPWKLLECWVLGTLQTCETWEPLDEFTSFKEARTEARRLARESVIRGANAEAR